ncbi:hypothetical protein [Paraburkholderia sacchari]|uniref:hypothetical protein n=1 Tax=Paraburkholderia sacchari TaxID=159450 RepID=UPI0005443DF0|nr:hypothetical protein [Paraburkholderia sacchari]NLP65562.1 hypothetical protein [Paraburkholderia sacchari]
MVFRIDTDPDRSADRITDLYRSLTVVIVAVEGFSSARSSEQERAEQIAAQIRALCAELERLLSVADDGDDVSKSLLPRRVGVLEREIQMLVGRAQALVGSQLDRVDSGWKR